MSGESREMQREHAVASFVEDGLEALALQREILLIDDAIIASRVGVTEEEVKAFFGSGEPSMRLFAQIAHALGFDCTVIFTHSKHP